MFCPWVAKFSRVAWSYRLPSCLQPVPKTVLAWTWTHSFGIFRAGVIFVYLAASFGSLMFQLLRNYPELFVNQRVLHRPPLCQVYSFTWYPDEGLTIWLFLDETDRSQVAISCFACYICHYDVIQELAAPSVSSDE